MPNNLSGKPFRTRNITRQIYIETEEELYLKEIVGQRSTAR